MFYCQHLNRIFYTTYYNTHTLRVSLDRATHAKARPVRLVLSVKRFPLHPVLIPRTFPPEPASNPKENSLYDTAPPLVALTCICKTGNPTIIRERHHLRGLVPACRSRVLSLSLSLSRGVKRGQRFLAHARARARPR